MIDKKIKIVETSLEDLNNVVTLWNDGDVMKFVGFPNGLGVTYDKLEKNWLPFVNKINTKKHYSIYHEELGYCGESYYEVLENGKAALDIKLFSKARGKGIAFAGLNHAIKNAFTQGKVNVVFVDPQKTNEKALRLYEKFGFKEFPHPDESESDKHFYLELSKQDYHM